jgi:DNA-binding MarR family transcriptional regulator
MTDTNQSLGEVLDAVMLEESRPSRLALLRWQKRFPQYSQELADFFKTWALQDIREESPDQVVVDEDKLAAKGVSEGLEMMRRQGRIVPIRQNESLKPLDQLVLTAVQLLRFASDEVEITVTVSQLAGRRILLGSTSLALERLERKGLVSARTFAEDSETENEATQYFTITLAGERALEQAVATAQAVADYLKGFA